jgi:hypothetical protein
MNECVTMEILLSLKIMLQGNNQQVHFEHSVSARRDVAERSGWLNVNVDV